MRSMTASFATMRRVRMVMVLLVTLGWGLWFVQNLFLQKLDEIRHHVADLAQRLGRLESSVAETTTASVPAAGVGRGVVSPSVPLWMGDGRGGNEAKRRPSTMMCSSKGFFPSSLSEEEEEEEDEDKAQHAYGLPPPSFRSSYSSSMRAPPPPSTTTMMMCGRGDGVGGGTDGIDGLRVGVSEGAAAAVMSPPVPTTPSIMQRHTTIWVEAEPIVERAKDAVVVVEEEEEQVSVPPPLLPKPQESPEDKGATTTKRSSSSGRQAAVKKPRATPNKNPRGNRKTAEPTLREITIEADGIDDESLT